MKQLLVLMPAILLCACQQLGISQNSSQTVSQKAEEQYSTDTSHTKEVQLTDLETLTEYRRKRYSTIIAVLSHISYNRNDPSTKFLNFGGAYPNEKLRIPIFEEKKALLNGIKVGDTLKIIGIIKDYEGKKNIYSKDLKSIEKL